VDGRITGFGLDLGIIDVALSGALALDAATAVASNGTPQTVTFRDGTVVPAIGQGSWHVEREIVHWLLTYSGLTVVIENLDNGLAEKDCQ
jgi:hypothetical protein